MTRDRGWPVYHRPVGEARTSNDPPALPLATLVAATATAGAWLWVGSELTPATAAAAALIALGSFALTAGALTGRSGPMMLTFWPFVIVTVGLATLAQFSYRAFPKLDLGLTRYYDEAVLLAFAAAFCYAIGYGTGWRRPNTSSASDAHPSGITRAGGRRLLMSVAMALAAFPISLAGGVGFTARFQSRDDLLATYARAGQAYVQGESIIFTFLKTMPTLLAIAATALSAHEYMRRRRHGLPRGNALLTLLVASVSFVVFANPLSNSRYVAASGLLAVAFAVLRLRTWRTRLAFAVGLTTAIVVAYPAAAAFKSDTVANRLESGSRAFTTVDFDGMQQTAAALAYVDARGHTNGRVVASGVLFALPRAAWEGKSLPSSYLTTEARNYRARNLSQPLWSEFYLDFGWPFALFSFTLFGRLSARLDGRFRRSGGGVAMVVVAGCAAVQIGFLRGPMGAQVVIAAPLVVGLAFAVWLSLRGSGTELARPPRLAPRRRGQLTTRA